MTLLKAGSNRPAATTTPAVKKHMDKRFFNTRKYLISDDEIL
jgi:hypothetical protein